MDSTHVEITGTIGVPETERRSTLQALFSPPSHDTAAKLIAKLGEKYGYTVSKKNAAEITSAVIAVIPQAQKGIPEIDKRETIETVTERREANLARQAKQETRYVDARASWTPVLAAAPKWASALIMAELDQDDSDSMTDYFAHKTTRQVVIGFRRSSRESFKELRAAAARFEPTAHMGPDASKDVEHRDNYSMGSGNYVKAGHTHSSGWRVVSRNIPSKVDNQHTVIEMDECATAKAIPATATLDSTGSARIEEHMHTKKGFPMFLVIPSDRLDSETFNALRQSCKEAGGWYSRKWGRTPGGFAFKDQGDAKSFMAAHFPDDGTPTPPTDSTPGPEEGPEVPEEVPEVPEEVPEEGLDKLPHGASIGLAADHASASLKFGEHVVEIQPCHWFTAGDYDSYHGQGPKPVRLGSTRLGRKAKLIHGWYARFQSTINGIGYETAALLAPGLGSDWTGGPDGKNIPHAPDQYSLTTPSGGCYDVHINRNDGSRTPATDAASSEIRRRLGIVAEILTDWSHGPDANRLFEYGRRQVVKAAKTQAEDLCAIAEEWIEHAQDLSGVDMYGNERKES